MLPPNEPEDDEPYRFEHGQPYIPPTEEPPPFVPDDGRFDADLIISWRAARAWAARSGRRT